MRSTSGIHFFAVLALTAISVRDAGPVSCSESARLHARKFRALRGDEQQIPLNSHPSGTLGGAGRATSLVRTASLVRATSLVKTATLVRLALLVIQACRAL